MRRELGLLNIICIFVAFGFLVLAAISVISSGDFLTIVPMLIVCIMLLFVFFPDSFRSAGLRYKFKEEPPVAPVPVEEP